MNDLAKLLTYRIEQRILADLEPDTAIQLDDISAATYDVLTEYLADGDHYDS